ncbi:MAG: hypothetical protein ABIS45_17125 [Burkholderiales bacterium]
MDRQLATQVVAHHLRLFGVDDISVDESEERSARVLLLAGACANDIERTKIFAEGGGTAIAILPGDDFCGAFRVMQIRAGMPVPAVLTYQYEHNAFWARLRTLHAYYIFQQADGTTIVSDQANAAVWFWLPVKSGGVLFIGTDLAADFTRYRQGDPAKATIRPTEARWGITGERPNYLFEEQLDGESPQERHADWWAIALAKFVSVKLGRPLRPILPGGALGAVIITGDDDQAYLEKYREQLAILEQTPITYFLHPLTRHSRDSLQKMLRSHRVDLGIHPDALDAPERYGQLLHEQATWYRDLTGTAPLSVRNHGFLNDGYWGHLSAWLREAISISSNLPGLDGHVLNGSLLPGRVAYEGNLTHHWSLLTAFGDGMVFALKMSDERAAEKIHLLAARIVESGIPGIIVLNLHPQNISESRAMHHAAIEIIRSGFLPWTMRDCLDWFRQKEGLPPFAKPRPLLNRLTGWLRSWN